MPKIYFYICLIANYIKFGYNMNLPLCQDCPVTSREFSPVVNTQDAINSELENALCVHSIVLILMKHLHACSFSAGFLRAP